MWLKQWDACVFGSEVRSTSEEVLSALRRHSSIAQHQKQNDSGLPRNNRGRRWSHGSFRHSNDLEHENSNPKNIQDLWNKKTRFTGPPEQKVSHNFGTALFSVDKYLVSPLTRWMASITAHSLCNMLKIGIVSLLN